MVLSSTQLQKVYVTLWFRRLQCLVKRFVLSVFINLRYAECVCSQTNKLNKISLCCYCNCRPTECNNLLLRVQIINRWCCSFYSCSLCWWILKMRHTWGHNATIAKRLFCHTTFLRTLLNFRCDLQVFVFYPRHNASLSWWEVAAVNAALFSKFVLCQQYHLRAQCTVIPSINTPILCVVY